MKRQALAYERLTKLLFALEEEVLEISDVETVTTLNAGLRGVDDVTHLFSAELFKQQGKSTVAAVKTSPKVRARRSVAAQSAAHIAPLRRLLMARPELSPQLHAMFSAGGKPGAEEVERLIAELMRKGVLSKDE